MTDAPPKPSKRWIKRALLAGGIGLLGALLALWFGVDHQPLSQSPRARSALPSEVQARFEYPEAALPPEPIVDRLEDSGREFEERFVQLWVTTPGDPERHKVQILEFRSTQPGPRPAVVVTPMFGGRQPIARLIAPALAERGIHALVVLRAERYLVGDAPPERLERVLRTAVIDRRRTLDYLASRQDVDPKRLGAIGVSLGGLGTALLCASDARIKAGVLVLAGGGLETLIPASQERRALEFVEAWGARGVSPEALSAKIKSAVPSDPLLLAQNLDPRLLLFVTARRDKHVPARNQELLWEAAGRPERYSLPTGHATSAVYAPWLAPLCLDWLQARLEE
jgi:dienelactone hydrolase